MVNEYGIQIFKALEMGFFTFKLLLAMFITADNFKEFSVIISKEKNKFAYMKNQKSLGKLRKLSPALWESQKRLWLEPVCSRKKSKCLTPKSQLNLQGGQRRQNSDLACMH